MSPRPQQYTYDSGTSSTPPASAPRSRSAVSARSRRTLLPVLNGLASTPYRAARSTFKTLFAAALAYTPHGIRRTLFRESNNSSNNDDNRSLLLPDYFDGASSQTQRDRLHAFRQARVPDMFDPKLAFVPPGYAVCCSLLSFFGVLFLFIMGRMIKSGTEMIVGGAEPFPHDKLSAIGSACYQAGGLYLVLLLFCSCQAYIHAKRNSLDARDARSRVGSAVPVDELRSY